jgi:hypothetical protein
MEGCVSWIWSLSSLENINENVKVIRQYQWFSSCKSIKPKIIHTFPLIKCIKDLPL